MEPRAGGVSLWDLGYRQAGVDDGWQRCNAAGTGFHDVARVSGSPHLRKTNSRVAPTLTTAVDSPQPPPPSAPPSAAPALSLLVEAFERRIAACNAREVPLRLLCDSTALLIASSPAVGASAAAEASDEP